MSVQLHLFSTPGIGTIEHILNAARLYIQPAEAAHICYLPWASTANTWLDYTQRQFAGLAEIDYLDPATTTAAEIEQILDRVSAVYISGGNTYLLNHRLHERGVYEPLRQRALAGLPIIGFSAGALICGPNMLTTHDINMLPTTHFEALNLIPWNIVAHYPTAPDAQADEDDWLGDYQAAHTNPILAIADEAGVEVTGKQLTLKFGSAWLLSQDGKKALANGEILTY